MSECKQVHAVGKAPSRRAHRGMEQNHMPVGWAEEGARGCDGGLPGCIFWGFHCGRVHLHWARPIIYLWG